MPIHIDITKNAIYQEVKRESFEKGLKKRVNIDIIGLLKQGKLGIQDIAAALDVPKELVLSIRDEMKNSHLN